MVFGDLRSLVITVELAFLDGAKGLGVLKAGRQLGEMRMKTETNFIFILKELPTGKPQRKRVEATQTLQANYWLRSLKLLMW
jgi:hypothetical protein